YTALCQQGSAMSLYINGIEQVDSRLTLIDEKGSMSANIIVTLGAGAVIALGASKIETKLTLPGETLNAYVTLTPLFI
ncbi:MAG: hypothetical protein RR839_04710, partial [Oscillospiraceae bacterium]